MNLRSTTITVERTKAYHFNLFSTILVSEPDFHNILISSTTSIPTWGRYSCFEAGGTAVLLLNDSDLDDFEDTRVRMLAFYVATWYNNAEADNVDK